MVFNKNKLKYSKIFIFLIFFSIFSLIFSIYSNITLHNKINLLTGKAISNTGNSFELQEKDNKYDSLGKKISIVAVSNKGDGVVGKLNLRLIPGNNNVLIDTNPFSEPDIQYSVNKAVTVAKLRTNYNYDKDFIFNYDIQPSDLIGGGSAGAATTILTIAALEGKDIKDNVIISGTINDDGTIGPVAGLLEKAKAVSDAGYKKFLIPKGQSTITFFEKQVSKKSTGGFEILSTHLVPTKVNLNDLAGKWGLEIIEVSNIDEALSYFIEGYSAHKSNN